MPVEMGGKRLVGRDLRLRGRRQPHRRRNRRAVAGRESRPDIVGVERPHRAVERGFVHGERLLDCLAQKLREARADGTGGVRRLQQKSLGFDRFDLRAVRRRVGERRSVIGQALDERPMWAAAHRSAALAARQASIAVSHSPVLPLMAASCSFPARR